MAEIILSDNGHSSIDLLIDTWLKQEQEGEKFPVDFEIAWQLAGYFDKATGKRRLISKSSLFLENDDYRLVKGVISKTAESLLNGRSSDSILLTCDAFKQFCLLAKTEQGRQIRQYFIEAEKKWRLVQQHHPQVAQEVDRLRELELQNENLRLEVGLVKAKKQLVDAETSQLQFRHTVVATCPEPMQQKILGYQMVDRVEYRDRLIRDGQLINDGSTINKTELCRRYSFTTKNGAPDYKKLNKYLENLPQEVWKDVPVVRDNAELKREYLELLDRQIYQSDRQLFIVERFD